MLLYFNIFHSCTIDVFLPQTERGPHINSGLVRFKSLRELREKELEPTKGAKNIFCSPLLFLFIFFFDIITKLQFTVYL